MDGGFQAVRAACKNLHIRTLLLKKKSFLLGKLWDFLTIWWKSPFWLVENQKKMDIYGIQLEDRQIQNLQLCTPWTGLVM
jgi:hypothetical protein